MDWTVKDRIIFHVDSGRNGDGVMGFRRIVTPDCEDAGLPLLDSQ